MAAMTIEEVKRELPPVLILWNGKKYGGRVTGRLNKFASVSPHTLGRKDGRVDIIMGPIFEFSWDAVCSAVNTGKPLRA